MYYDRVDMPITVSFAGAERKIGWKLELEHIDYHLYIPIFLKGLREVNERYKFLAIRGFIFILGMQSTYREKGNKIGCCVAPVDSPN